jgi:hypothetical protein
MARAKTSAKGLKKPAPAAAAVRGAVPYQPRMSKADARAAVEDRLGERIKLAKYRSTVTPPLTQDERELLIGQTLAMLERVYAHLPMKRALHANDPVQALQLLRLRHAGLDDRAFHSAMMDVVLGLRDLHTNYFLPTGYQQKFAFLPFRVEEFYEPGGVEPDGVPPVERKRRYAVSWVSPVNTVASLKEGMVVTHWNGSPIDLAVARNGSREAGSNADARRAQGIESLTLRWLGSSLPPDEDWVILTYTDDKTKKEYDARFDWEVIDPEDRPALLAGLEGRHAVKLALGLDLNRVLLDRVRKLIFDPQAVAVEQEAAVAVSAAGAAAEPPRAQTSKFPEVFERFGAVTVAGVGTFGYVRLRSFAPKSKLINPIVDEFARILATLPPTGLILDVRGNGGGYINIGERILQMLTPREITPEPFHFLATPLTLAIATGDNGWGAWKETIGQGIESGASFSQGFPLTDPRFCNDVGQVYQGPVVLVTDALCYSTTDIFTAGFQDHGIGPILGCHASTGAGGATVWDHEEDLQKLILAPVNPFAPLPQGAGMRVAALRCTRVGDRTGLPVEDYGVASNPRYYMTKADVVEHNEDLIAAAARLLNTLPKQSLRLAPVAGAPGHQYTVDCANIDRLDLMLNGRPVVSQDVTAPSFTVSRPAPATAGIILEARGYRQGELVVGTRLRV